MSPLELPLKISDILRNFSHPWFIAGGWAIDLYLKRQTREHEDIEILIFRRDQLIIRQYLETWEFTKVDPSTNRREPWKDGEWLSLPIHEIHVTHASGHLPKFEILLNECSEEFWKFRRMPEIRRSLTLVGRCTEDGIPFVSPEIVLLYKAKNPNSLDEEDFSNVIEVLEKEPRDWLRQAMTKFNSRHHWLEFL